MATVPTSEARAWRARWIWWFPDGRPPEPPWDQGAPRLWERESWVMLRRSFRLDAAPAAGARCRVTADGRYRLWVNGRELGRGPVRSEPSRLTYDTYDLPLVAGENVVAVLARWYGRPTLYWKPAPLVGELGRGGFLFESTVEIDSDASWRARPGPYVVAGEIVSDGPPDAEVVLPVSDAWTRAGFDDAGWDHAVELDPRALGVMRAAPPTEPFGVLEPRPIPQLAARTVEPVAEVARTRDSVVLDFGGVLNAHLEVASSAPEVELVCGEEWHDGEVVTAPRDWRMAVLGPGEVEAFEPVGFRFVRVAVGGGGEVSQVRVRAIERTYPRPPGAWFRCSDPELERIWEAGVRTLDLCSTDAFLDCPGREQRAWLGDGYLHTLLTFVVNPDHRLARWNLRLQAQGARADGLLPQVAAGDYGMRAITIPDSSLLWIMGLARYVEHAPDDPLVQELLPAAARALDAFERYRDDDGLVTDLPGWVFIDWAQLERGSKQAAIDATYAIALEDFARMCERVGDAGSAARARARAERSRAALEAYWDGERGAYVDALGGRRVSQQTNAIAILSGGVPRERWDAILDRVQDPERLVLTRTPGDPGTFAERMRSQFLEPGCDDEHDVVLAQPFYAHFLHQALARAGRFEDILASVRRWSAMLASGNGCFGEYWDHAPGLGSRCHAWSGTPTFDLTRHVLGIRYDGSVEPHLAGLAWAEGVVPVRDGWAYVRAEAGAPARVEILGSPEEAPSQRSAGSGTSTKRGR